MTEMYRSIELTQLLALRAVAEAGTFWQAAEFLHTAHSSLSDHVAALEARTGQRLVERSRGRRSVQLTEAGRLLVAHASAIEARLRAAQADLQTLARGDAGTVQVGIYQSLANRVLPELMQEFSASWPTVRLQVQEVLDDPHLVLGIERGDLDVCFDVQPVPPGPFETRDLVRDPYVLVCATTSPLVGHKPTATDLSGLPMVAYLPGRTFELVEMYLARAGVKPHIVYRSNDNATVQAMVAADLGFAVMPCLAVRQGDPELSILELAEPIPSRVITAVWHRDRILRPPIRALVEIAASIISRIDRKRPSRAAIHS